MFALFSLLVGPALAATPTEMTYCTRDGVKLALDLYTPSTAAGPVVVLVHGGGWVKGDKRDGAVTILVDPLLARGITVASVNYRYANGSSVTWDDQVGDIVCAVDFLRGKLAESSVGLMGASAGGHLAAMASVDAGVPVFVGWYTPSDLTVDFAGLSSGTKQKVFGTKSPTAEQRAAASPQSFASQFDAVYLAHGTRDDVVPVGQSQSFQAKLVAAGASAELNLVADANHGWGGASKSTIDAVVSATVDWLDRNLP